MKKLGIIFCLLFAASTAFAAESAPAKRGNLAAFGYFEGRGFSNALLFPLEWGHLPRSETHAVPIPGVGYLFSGATHLCVRLYSGFSDMVWMPLYYPFSKYDDSVPVGMGWGEFPWDKPNS